MTIHSEDVTADLLARMRLLKRDEQRAASLVPWRPFGRPTLDAVRRGVAMALAEERSRVAAELDRIADDYEAQGRVETDWLTVSHAFRSAAERVLTGGRP